MVGVIDTTKEFFVVHFASKGNYHHALFEGPWLATNHYLLIQCGIPLSAGGESCLEDYGVG